jgi:hypothetical protein
MAMALTTGHFDIRPCLPILAILLCLFMMLTLFGHFILFVMLTLLGYA